MSSKPMKIVVYHDLEGWKCTSESNYNARIQNARLIYKLGNDLQEAIQIVKYNFGDDYRVIEKSA